MLAKNIRIECNRGFTVFCDSKPNKYSNQKVSLNTKWFNGSRVEIRVLELDAITVSVGGVIPVGV